MKRALLVAAALVCSCAVGVTAALGVRSATRRAQTEDVAFHSAALDSEYHFLIWLPPGYATSGRHYPVIYFLHGLPSGPSAYQSLGWVQAALAATGRQAILVVPQGTRRAGGDPEYHDWGPGRNWSTAISRDLVRYVDGHYRTIAGRGGRALIGVSAGGYGAASIGLSHPATYGVVESWSGYFTPTDPSGATRLDVGSDADNEAASVYWRARRLQAQFRRFPTYFAFYVGASDPTFVDDNVELDRELRSLGVPHVFAVYTGGHSRSLWSPHAPGWLEMALDHLHAAA